MEPSTLVLNQPAHKGPMPGRMSPGGTRIRDTIFNNNFYRLRYVGLFRALTVEFRDRLKTRRKESTETESS